MHLGLSNDAKGAELPLLYIDGLPFGGLKTCLVVSRDGRLALASDKADISFDPKVAADLTIAPRSHLQPLGVFEGGIPLISKIDRVRRSRSFGSSDLGIHLISQGFGSGGNFRQGFRHFCWNYRHFNTVCRAIL